MPDSSTIPLTRHGNLPGPDVSVPRQLGSVRLIRELGRGGMGVVWLGHDDMLGRDVAVKFLLGAVASPEDPDFETFVTGARAAAALKHPGLTAIHHAGLIERVPYIVMEFIDGPSLDQLIHRTGPLSIPVGFLVLRSICAAVGELHDHSITHRDIKPGNILLDPDARIVVTDFGLSCRRPFGEVHSRLQLAGTPMYMSPEMYEGEVSPRADVYALGILAFELFAGAPPYEGEPSELRERHRVTPLPLERLAALPPELIAAIDRATNKNPRLRYRTAHHVGLALDSVRMADFAEAKAGAELRRRVAACRGHASAPASPSPPRDSSTYYQSLSSIAAARRSIASPDPAPAATLPSRMNANSIAHSLNCLSCNYDLRGLDPASSCPECGNPVATSIAPDRLLFADRGWLKRIILGQWLLLVGAATTTASIPVFAFLFVLLSPLMSPDAGLVLGSARLTAAFSIMLGGIASLLILPAPIGVWYFSSPEPLPHSRCVHLARLVGRWATSIASAATILGIPALAIHSQPALYRALSVVASCSLSLGLLGLGIYTRSLARRVPHPPLARNARDVILAASAMVVLWPVMTAANYLFSPTIGV